MSSHYIRKIYNFDMGLKAENNHEARARFQTSGILTATYDKIVGPELKPLFDRWYAAKSAVAAAKPDDPKLGELRQNLNKVLAEMREPATNNQISKAVASFLDQARERAEMEYDRFERRKQPTLQAKTASQRAPGYLGTSQDIKDKGDPGKRNYQMNDRPPA